MAVFHGRAAGVVVHRGRDAGNDMFHGRAAGVVVRDDRDAGVIVLHCHGRFIRRFARGKSAHWI